METARQPDQTARLADVFGALGAEPRLRIVRLLLAAHPQGMVAGDLQGELGIAASTLSHHLEKLRMENLVNVRREGTFLWYTANGETLRQLVGFLYAECCTRNQAISASAILKEARQQCECSEC
jgi:DNA-binding transcriptional ArsR family regulator